MGVKLKDLHKRYEHLMTEALYALRLSDEVGFALCGPTYVPAPPPPQGPGGLVVGWMIEVSLRHNVLVGQDDISVTVPLMGTTPPEEAFAEGTKYILEKAREIRDQANAEASAPLVDANVPEPGARVQLPPGVVREPVNLSDGNEPRKKRERPGGMLSKSSGR